MAHPEQTDHHEERIKEIAYFLWLKEGCPKDQADRHWAAAEAVVTAQDEDARDRAMDRHAKSRAYRT
jgi:hypothetical protein